MLQGGDPTGLGTGGESIYGGKFKDELDSRLVHSGRGVLSMANSGPNTNGSQFFIMYKSARHLDFKHSVFGRVVGGLETISALEKVPTNADDRPLQPITITGATVFTNPFKDMMEEEAKAEQEKINKQREASGEAENARVGAWYSRPGGATEVQRAAAAQRSVAAAAPARQPTAIASAAAAPGSTAAAPSAQLRAIEGGVGKYLPVAALGTGVKMSAAAPAEGVPAAKKAKTLPQSKFGNFDAW